MSKLVSRRSLLAASSAAMIASPQVVRSAERPVTRIGLVADAQYADVDPSPTRFYRSSIGKLEAAVEHFNGRELDFCVHLGDVIDRTWSSFDEVLKPLAKCRHRLYHLLGNHDFAVLDTQKARVPERMGLTKRYYAFDRAGFRFVVLDTTEVSTYAHPAGSPEEQAAAAVLQRLIAAELPFARPWNSGVGPRQLEWFETQCREAAAAGRQIIVFAHHPVFPAGNSHNTWNSEELLTAIDRHRNVAAWINGHNHAGAFGIRAGVPYLTMHGMVETPDTNAFAVAEVFADRIVVTGHGREPSRELLLRKA